MPLLRGVVAGIAFVLGLVLLLGGLLIGSITFLMVLVNAHALDVGTTITLVSCVAAVAGAFGLFWCSREVGGEYGPIKDYRQRRHRRRATAA